MCACRNHPHNYLGNAGRLNIQGCKAACERNPRCKIVNHYAGGACHMYSKDCPCNHNHHQRKYILHRLHKGLKSKTPMSDN